MIVTKKNLLTILLIAVVFISVSLAKNWPEQVPKNTQILPSLLGRNNKAGKLEPIATSTKEAEDPITAKAYLVGNIDTGVIYFEKNSRMVLPIASMSKLVTAVASVDFIDQTKTVSITADNLNVYPDSSKLEVDEKFTVEELLYPLLLSSSNVAAEAIASSTDRIEFLGLMTGYAWEVGMPSTKFADPSGLSSTNSSSARDFFALSKYIYKSKPGLLEITRNARVTTGTTSDHFAHSFTSTHPFVNDPRFLGGKTGYTPEAGDTMLTILKMANQPIAIIVLGSSPGKRAADTSYLIGLMNKVPGF